MKRILLAFALVFVFCMSSLAQKTYVTVSFSNYSAFLSGDVPATLQRSYGASDVPKEEKNGGRSLMRPLRISLLSCFSFYFCYHAITF